MRPIDADALIEKCGGWYVDECTESGFIGTLENLLATEPTIQPQSTTGQLNDGARSTAQSTDLIDRQAALDAVGKYASVWMEYTDAMSKDEIAQIALNNAKSTMIRILKELPTIQPEVLACGNGELVAKPEPHEGHWIPHESPDGGEQYECSRCGVLWEFNDGTPEDNEAYFCPKCGARMTK